MIVMSGWIKLHKSLLDWEWYDDTNATRLLIHLLLSVNYKDKKWHGETIKAGSMVLSWDTLSAGCCLTKQQCRTAMGKLESSGEVTRKATNKYQLVTLVKWEKLQSGNRQITDKPTDKQQTSNRQITPTKEYKEYKEREEVYKESGHLSITLHEFNKLVEHYGSAKADEYVDKVLNYSLNHKYKSLYLTANAWLKKDLNTNSKALQETEAEAKARKQAEADKL